MQELGIVQQRQLLGTPFITSALLPEPHTSRRMTIVLGFRDSEGKKLFDMFFLIVAGIF